MGRETNLEATKPGWDGGGSVRDIFRTQFSWLPAFQIHFNSSLPLVPVSNFGFNDSCLRAGFDPR
jgi:hypothetical protein